MSHLPWSGQGDNRRERRSLTRTVAIRAIGFVALAGACATGVAGVGYGMSRASAAGTMATSVSFRVDLHADPATGSPVDLTALGQMDFVHHTLAAMVTVPADGIGAVAGASGPLTFRCEWVGGRAYMTVPTALAQVANGAHLVSLPVSARVRQEATTVLAQSAAALSYAQILFGDLTTHQAVDRVGSKMIGGVRVQGTAVTITLDELLKLAPALTPVMETHAGSMADTPIRATVWIDRRGRLVEMAMARGKGAALTGTLRFYGYDAALPLHAPSPGSVSAMPAALRQLLASWYIF